MVERQAENLKVNGSVPFLNILILFLLILVLYSNNFFMLFGLFNFVYLNYLVFFLIFFFLSTNTLRFSSLNLFFKNPLNMVFNQAKLLNFN